jgi:hypothetical protein
MKLLLEEEKLKNTIKKIPQIRSPFLTSSKQSKSCIQKNGKAKPTSSDNSARNADKQQSLTSLTGLTCALKSQTVCYNRLRDTTKQNSMTAKGPLKKGRRHFGGSRISVFRKKKRFDTRDCG